MTKFSLAFSAFMAAAGTAFIIFGMSTSNVIKVCHFHVSPIPQSFSRLGFRQPPSLRGTDMTSSDEKVTKTIEVCIEQGLFFIKFSLSKGILYLPTPLETRSQTIRMVAGFLLVGGVGGSIAALFFTLASCHAVKGNSKFTVVTATRNKTGTIVLTLSFILLLIGMSIYTHQKMKNIGNPHQFASQIVSALTGIENVFDETSGSQNSINYVKKISSNRASVRFNPSRNTLPKLVWFGNHNNRTNNNDISNAKYNDSVAEKHANNNNSDVHENYKTFMNEISKTPFVSDDLRLKDYPTEIEERRKKRSSSRGHPAFAGIIRMGLSMFSQPSKVIPLMDYSFYTLWVGCLMYLIALVCGVIRWIRFVKNINLQQCKV